MLQIIMHANPCHANMAVSVLTLHGALYANALETMGDRRAQVGIN